MNKFNVVELLIEHRIQLMNVQRLLGLKAKFGFGLINNMQGLLGARTAACEILKCLNM